MDFHGFFLSAGWVMVSDLHTRFVSLQQHSSNCVHVRRECPQLPMISFHGHHCQRQQHGAKITNFAIILAK